MDNIRTYRDRDFIEVLELLSRSCRYDTFTGILLREKFYFDPSWNPEAVLVAEKDGSVIGFMQGVCREVRGVEYAYLKLFAVDPEHRRQGIAREMYRILEAYFARLGCQYIRLMDVPLNYYMPGIDPRYTEAVCFALNAGFERNGDAVNMQVDLNYRSWDTAKERLSLSLDDIEVRRAKHSDLADILDLIAIDWALWEFEVRSAMSNEPPTVYIACQQGKVKAFAAWDANNKGTGWFGPMGTALDLRGKGIGRILLFMCLEEMQEKGLSCSTIPWVAPVSFYSHYTGAVIDRVFWRFEKRLLTE